MQLFDTWANLNRWHGRPVEMSLLAGGMLVLAIVLPPIPCGIAILIISMMAALTGARIPPGVYLRAMVIPLTFLTLSSLALILSVAWSKNSGLSIQISPAGVAVAQHTVLRALAALSALILLVLTTPLSEIMALLRRARLPVVLLDLMGLVYRMLFIFDQILQAMLNAQKSRLGYRTLHTSFRSLAMAVTTLFMRTLEQARRMEIGLDARGYDGELRVLSLNHRVSRRALALIVLTHGFLILLGIFSTKGIL